MRLNDSQVGVSRSVVMYIGTPKRENQDVRRAWRISPAVMECTWWTSIQFVQQLMKVPRYRKGKLRVTGDTSIWM